MTNADILTRALEAFADPARRAEYLDLYAEDAVLHGYPGVQPGREGIRAFYDAFWASFPDARVHADEIIEHDNRLIVRFHVTGTHGGPFLGIAGTGRSIQIGGITILDFRNGKCTERWSGADFLPVLMQIGAFTPLTRG